MSTKVYVDGSYRPEGAAACVVIYYRNEEVFRTVKPLPHSAASSSVAEAEAILLAVNMCWIGGYKMPIIYTDAEFFCQQFWGATGIKSKDLFYYIDALKEIETKFGFILNPVKRKDVFVPDDICKTWLTTVDRKYKKDILQNEL